MSDAFALVDALNFARNVDDNDAPFASVIAVDNARGVGHYQAFEPADTASERQLEVEAVGRSGEDAEGNFDPGVGV